MGNGNRVEMLIAVCAVITSVVAVFIAWDQARVMRAQQKADVWPMLQITHQTDVNAEEVTYAIEIENSGVGPALIDGHYISIPDAADSGTFKALVGYMMAEGMGEPQLANASLEGRVMRQGGVMRPVSASWDTSEDRIAALNTRLEQYLNGEREVAVVFVCYCSILEDCWISSTLEHQNRPQPVKSCNAVARQADELLAVYSE